MVVHTAYGGASRLEVHTTPTHYWLSSPHMHSSLAYSRTSASPSLAALPDNATFHGHVFGLVGKVELLSGPHLVLIVEATPCGVFRRDPVFRVEEVEVVPLNTWDRPPSFKVLSQSSTRAASQSSSRAQSPLVESTDGSIAKPSPAKKLNRAQGALQKRLIKEIQKLFGSKQSGGMYFTHTGSMLVSELRRSKDSSADPIEIGSDFFWNFPMMKDVLDMSHPDARDWVLPVIQGFFDTQTVKLGGLELSILLVSRRNRRRLGTRFKRRGIDRDGMVANAVETEQILRAGPHILAFAQFRGSIPVFWSQEPENLEYRPAVKVSRTAAETDEAFSKHVENLISEYGPHQIWINLVNQHGREQVVGRAFAEAYSRVVPPTIMYHAFDYHSKCKRSTMHRVWEIAEAADIPLNMMGFTHAVTTDGLDNVEVRSSQQGLVRVNCMDCLDRTNVTQSVIGREMAHRMLLHVGLLAPKDRMPRKITRVLQSMWATNGNAISQQYAGTDAMKSEATQSDHMPGKPKNVRVIGALNDGRKSLKRYIINNFRDEFRQHALDLLQNKRSPAEVMREGIPLENDEHKIVLNRVLQFVRRTYSQVAGPGELCMGLWPVWRDDPDLQAEAIFMITNKKLYVVYVNFDSESIMDVSATPLEDIQYVLVGQPRKNEAKLNKMRRHVSINRSNNAMAVRIFVGAADTFSDRLANKEPVRFSDLKDDLSPLSSPTFSRDGSDFGLEAASPVAAATTSSGQDSPVVSPLSATTGEGSTTSTALSVSDGNGGEEADDMDAEVFDVSLSAVAGLAPEQTDEAATDLDATLTAIQAQYASEEHDGDENGRAESETTEGNGTRRNVAGDDPDATPTPFAAEGTDASKEETLTFAGESAEPGMERAEGEDEDEDEDEDVAEPTDVPERFDDDAQMAASTNSDEARRASTSKPIPSAHSFTTGHRASGKERLRWCTLRPVKLDASMQVVPTGHAATAKHIGQALERARGVSQLSFAVRYEKLESLIAD